jgi:hypothetical protein
MNEDGIDFVILWVDGNDPEHIEKRRRYSSKDLTCLPQDIEQSLDDKRFLQSDELLYCLRSIKWHAPWYRKIWLVTDNQIPNFLDHRKLAKDRITIVDHTILFSGKEHYLPTFNTRSIASLIYAIPGLSKKFIYGNDDFMLGAPVDESFFFSGDMPVIYGDWTGITHESNSTLFQQGMINAAKLLGYDSSNFIHVSHGFQPMSTDIFIHLRAAFPNEFENNLAFRFRHRSQLLIESLHNHFCHREYSTVVNATTPMVHFSFQLCRDGAEQKIRFLFNLIAKGERNMFCINEFQSLALRFPDLGRILDETCGRRLVSER